jgi:Spy/CpxP family protein refolding chaperone
MLNSPRSRWIAAVSVAALLVSAGIAVAGEGKRPGRRARHERMVRAARHRAMERIDALSDDQAKAALDASKDLGRIRDDLRGKAAAIRLQAFRDAKASPDKRPEIREAARAKMKALRAEARVPFTEAGMKVVRTLTPEQRAKIEAAGKARGRTVTDEGMARSFGRRLSRPWAQALLKARVDAGATK